VADRRAAPKQPRQNCIGVKDQPHAAVPPDRRRFRR
jgi:hypothetical protein